MFLIMLIFSCNNSSSKSNINSLRYKEKLEEENFNDNLENQKLLSKKIYEIQKDQAIKKGNIDNSKSLEMQEDILIKENISPSALKRAVVTEDENLLNYLLKRRIDPDIKDSSGRTPLFYAINKNNFAFAKKILEFGANIKLASTKDNNILIYASRTGNLEMLKYLIENYDLDPNEVGSNGKTVLMSGARSGNVEIVKYLVEDKGMDIDAKDEKGLTPIISALDSEDLETFKYLLEKSKNFDIDFLIKKADVQKVEDILEYLKYFKKTLSSEIE